ncbi:alpha/beta fold hydrolase [Streptomyces griseocarneus]|uniref:alpha/beta fold hydrolase n=1 Tax=Streptomyces griseocarneus TaxID=51201 RepID=UPI00167D5E45|nr:alpha/beta hydrolase [Streptomyces griseocarneus]MBZ6473930.1 alpha/beta hydrolase [Streptomyces griseocarneus]
MTHIPALSTSVTGSGPGLLLAHGAGGSIEGNYAPIIPALAAAHTVVAPDYPGSGATPRVPGGLTVDVLADAIVAEADRAGLETFTLIGYSLGTLVSVRAATRHPERVRGLVLTAGLARPDNRLRASLDLWQKLLADGDLKAFARFVALSGFGEDFYNAVPEDQVAPFLDQIAVNVPAGAAEQAGAVGLADTTADLPGISVPTLVIATTQDTLVSPANSRYLADNIPGAEYAEIASGHIPMAERPEEWQKLITDFLERKGL